MISEIFNIGFKLFLYENSLISYLYWTIEKTGL